MSQKLPRIILSLSLFCLGFVIIADIPFFWYVQKFGLEISLYDKIYSWLENLTPLLFIPAAYALFRLLKLSELSGKPKLMLYFLIGIVLPLLFFPAIYASQEQISSDYLTFTGVILPRLYFKLIFVILISFYVLAPLADIIGVIKNKKRTEALKQLGKTVALGIISLAVSFVILLLVSYQITSLLDRLMLASKVENTLPTVSGYTNQQFVITDRPQPLIDCYLKQNPGDLNARILNQIAGNSFFTKLGYDAYFLNDHCLVVYLGTPLILTDTEVPTQTALLSELLIRIKYAELIRVNADKHPVDTISIRKEELYIEDGPRGTYDSDTNRIELQQGFTQVFQTITHELLHSFSQEHESTVNKDVMSGLDEAITQYLTNRIMQSVAGTYKPTTYKFQVEALVALLQYVDEKTVLEAYFNGDLRSLKTEVDSKTYRGAYCRFYHYLDQSLENYHNYSLTKEYAARATKALQVKEDDNVECF
ncbi:TPA: hypothetical protein DIS61_05375 [Patescibacteria group bacterium]|nr:hypothetical protein [Patescibacteria group bacterium]